MTDYDAIIVGGGPAGGTAAIRLAQAGWNVAVVEKAVFPRRKVCGEFISASTWPLLKELGVADTLLSRAGPVVRRIGLLAEAKQFTATIPGRQNDEHEGGRAIFRELLDAALLERAREAGARVWQPWAIEHCSSTAQGHACIIVERSSGRARTLRAPVLVAAHGSWESGPLPTQHSRTLARASDLLAFKARFMGCSLPADLMPLIAFPGGYGGMVHTGNGAVSVSFCMRRDQLAACRKRRRDLRSGAAALAHISEACEGVGAMLSAAKLESAWLAAGPIRPGIRGFGRAGIFTVGNAAGEAHPIVAEGISMAIQSAMLLTARLTAFPHRSFPLAQVRRSYARAWRRNFAPRLHASALFAQLFMRPVMTRYAIASIEKFPALLAMGARWSGKGVALHRGSAFPGADEIAGRPSAAIHFVDEAWRNK